MGKFTRNQRPCLDMQTVLVTIVYQRVVGQENRKHEQPKIYPSEIHRNSWFFSDEIMRRLTTLIRSTNGGATNQQGSKERSKTRSRKKKLHWMWNKVEHISKHLYVLFLFIFVMKEDHILGRWFPIYSSPARDQNAPPFNIGGNFIMGCLSPINWLRISQPSTAPSNISLWAYGSKYLLRKSLGYNLGFHHISPTF